MRGKQFKCPKCNGKARRLYTHPPFTASGYVYCAKCDLVMKPELKTVLTILEFKK